MTIEKLTQLFQAYDTATQEIERLEGLLIKAKEGRSDISKGIKEEFGTGPHTKDGKKVCVSHKGDTHFLKGAKG